MLRRRVQLSDIQFIVLVSLLVFFMLIFIFNVPKKLSSIIDPEFSELVMLQSELLAWKARVSDLEFKLKFEQEQNLLLTTRLNELIKRVEMLEGDTKILTKEKATLLVMGENAFGLADRNAMRRAGVLFHRLVNAGFNDLREELQRKRSEGRQYKIVHISSHAGADGIQFSDGLKDGNEVSDIMDGVELLFLASCSNVRVADSILGVVDNVVVVYENVDTRDMENFVFEFYNELKLDFDIRRSFNAALSKSPSVSEYVDLRTIH